MILLNPFTQMRPGIATGTFEVPVPVGTRFFFSLHVVQAGSGAQPASNPMGTGVAFLAGKSDRGVKLAAHLLVPRSRTRGCICPLPHIVRLHNVVLN
jgi:hypothetical protein